MNSNRNTPIKQAREPARIQGVTWGGGNSLITNALHSLLRVSSACISVQLSALACNILKNHILLNNSPSFYHEKGGDLLFTSPRPPPDD